MDYGFVFPAHIHIHKDVSYAEQHGFTHAWLYDSQMLFSDPYVSLAFCATNTKTIKLGTGVTNPSSRIAPVTANSFATKRNALAAVNSPIASARTATVTVCVPALPPIDATIGISTASATIFSIASAAISSVSAAIARMGSPS